MDPGEWIGKEEDPTVDLPSRTTPSSEFAKTPPSPMSAPPIVNSLWSVSPLKRHRFLSLAKTPAFPFCFFNFVFVFFFLEVAPGQVGTELRSGDGGGQASVSANPRGLLR